MKKFSAGFTLIELIVSITILAILAAVTVPSFRGFQRATRLENSVQIVETTLAAGFSTARSQRKIVTISGAENGAEIFSEKCDTDEKCEIGKFALESGVEFGEKFEVKFSPPFGDADFEELEKQESEKVVSIESGGDRVNLKIFKNSGLISRFFSDADEE
ncbi:prepilin-type N-terminal cleavage/methylation domain-containing protein [bacterium]|jgi:prepilin-type N-terminal cleavage/methylation domain-containing protein|nr:prepilin-type N-terminal cleavage/methylation domain-containing protein [bacterium]MBT6832322.1 prepilin-type N-terminal cleavage/methylation domain-containing protein [bacterium]MBT6996767.1 prepilin-type N-terminal cleavage/methylation domain-containing protein [bacterium]MBT7772820.1 prepilin-type N-terminal cleavage/methylation domain-containing protein [bacterium]